MFNLFGPVRVTEKTYNRFIDTGVVPPNVIRMLAFKVIRNEEMNEQEKTIFFNKTREVNEMIIKITNNK